MWRGIVVFLLLCGCMHSPTHSGAIAEKNRYNLSRIKVGMTQKEVVSIMGYPYSTNTIELQETGTIYQVWYYITYRTDLAQVKILPRNLTPIIFKDNSLQGWGRHYYLHLIEDKKDKEQHPYNEQKKESKLKPPMYQEDRNKQSSPPKSQEPKNEEDKKDFIWWE